MKTNTYTEFENDNLLTRLHAALNKAELQEIKSTLEDITADIYTTNPDLEVIELYSQLAEIIPSDTPVKANSRAIKAVHSENPSEVEAGTHILFYLYLRTTLKELDPYFVRNPDHNAEIFHAATEILLQNSKEFRPWVDKSRQFNEIIKPKLLKYFDEEFLDQVFQAGLISKPNPLPTYDEIISRLVNSEILGNVMGTLNDEELNLVKSISEFGDDTSALADFAQEHNLTSYQLLQRKYSLKRKLRRRLEVVGLTT